MSARVNTVSVAYLRALLDYAQARGIAPEQLPGGHAAALADRDARLPEAECAALFDHVAQRLQDPDLGLHVGEQIRPGHYGVLGYVVMNCATLGDALECLRRYQALVIDIGEPVVWLGPDELALSWNPEVEVPFRQMAECNLAGLVTFTRWMAGGAGGPVAVDLPYPAPRETAELRRVFGREPRFGRPRYRLALPRAWLDAPLVQPDAQMREMMLRLADRALLALPRGDTIARARGLIAQALSQGPPQLAAVAGSLGVAPRTLQRTLQEAGESFTDLVDGVRREVALRHLEDDALGTVDLAFLLGFSEQSAFQRAFKRWTGQTPGEYRRARKGAKAGA